MSTKLWIGMLVFYVLAQLICNFVEDDSMMTATNVSDLDSATSYTEVTSVTQAGAVISYFNKAWDFIKKVAFFDYSMFYDIDYATGAKTANNFAILRYLLICIGVVLIIEVFLVGRQVLLGS